MGSWGESFFQSDTTMDELGSLAKEALLHPKFRAALFSFAEERANRNKAASATKDKEVMQKLLDINLNYKDTDFKEKEKTFDRIFWPKANGVDYYDSMALFDEILIFPEKSLTLINKKEQKRLIEIIINYGHSQNKMVSAIFSQSLDWEDIAPNYNDEESNKNKKIYKTPESAVRPNIINSEQDDLTLRVILLAKMLNIFRAINSKDSTYIPIYFFKALIYSADYLLIGEGNTYHNVRQRVQSVSEEIMPLIAENLSGKAHYKFFKKHLAFIEGLESGAGKKLNAYKYLYSPLKETSEYQKQVLIEALKVKIGAKASANKI